MPDYVDLPEELKAYLASEGYANIYIDWQSNSSKVPGDAIFIQEGQAQRAGGDYGNEERQVLIVARRKTRKEALDTVMAIRALLDSTDGERLIPLASASITMSPRGSAFKMPPMNSGDRSFIYGCFLRACVPTFT